MTKEYDSSIFESVITNWFYIHGFQVEIINEDQFKISKGTASLVISADKLEYDYRVDDILTDGLPPLSLVSFGSTVADDPSITKRKQYIP